MGVWVKNSNSKYFFFLFYSLADVRTKKNVASGCYIIIRTYVCMCVCTRIYNIDVINAMQFIYAIISIFQHQLDSLVIKSKERISFVIEGSWVRGHHGAIFFEPVFVEQVWVRFFSYILVPLGLFFLVQVRVRFFSYIFGV